MMFRRGIILLRVSAPLVLLAPATLYSGETITGESKIEFKAPSKESGANMVDVRTKDQGTGGELNGRLEVRFDNSNTRLVAGALGDVEWETDGRSVSGRIIGPAGQEVAVLTGTITDGEMNGDFKDGAGRTGTWRWVGTLPESLTEE